MLTSKEMRNLAGGVQNMTYAQKYLYQCVRMLEKKQFISNGRLNSIGRHLAPNFRVGSNHEILVKMGAIGFYGWIREIREYPGEGYLGRPINLYEIFTK